MEKPEYLTMNELTEMMSYYGERYNNNCGNVEEFLILTRIVSGLQREYFDRRDAEEISVVYS